MSSTPEIAAALSGATLRQLSYWRSSRTSRSRTARPLLAPEVHLPRSRVSYSFRDVLALRTFVYLRANEVSLQRVRKVIAKMIDIVRPFGAMVALFAPKPGIQVDPRCAAGTR